jgi:hypothetical protein
MPFAGATITPEDAAAAYCRQARRVRARFIHRPARMHRELKDLGGPPPAPTSPARTFAQQVAARLNGCTMRYSERRELIRLATGRGIGEFEANLIIAAVQHEWRKASAVRQSPVEQPRVNRLRLLAPPLLVLVVESLVFVAAWRVCFG